MAVLDTAINSLELEEALKNCEREAIHQVGYIQPKGLLLALDDQGLLISHVSVNVSTWFPYSPVSLIGKPFSLLVGEQQAQGIRLLFNSGDWRRTAITTFDLLRNGRMVNLDAQISQSGALWIVEIEQDERGHDDLFQKLFIPIRDALWQLDAEADISRYTQKVVHQVRLLTGYDRVMMYQFDNNWDGDVIAESKSDEVESYSDAIINEASEAVMVTDVQRQIVSVNRAFTAITGYTQEEVIGQTPRILKSGVHTPNYYDSMYAALEEKHYWAGEIWNRRKNGEIYPQWGSITLILDNLGNPKNYIAVFSDVSKAKQAEEHLYHLANYDALTGLANRSKFVDHLNQALERAKRNGGYKVAVAFIDLDRFKIINDTLGHAVGDLFLKAIATRISSECSNVDLLSRWGGDEFVLAMDNITGTTALADSIRRILEVVKQPLQIEGHELEPTLSIGISIFPDDANDTTDLVKAADTAMYRVKAGGRNGFEFFTELHADENKKKFEIVSELNRALRFNEFFLDYQPQVNTKTGKIVGLEALVRWQHPQRGMLNPATFIQLAEELGLINQLGEWVLQAACLQMAQWQKAGISFPRVAVNLSPSQLNHALVDYVQRILTENGLSADKLELELTEGALELGVTILPVMEALRKMGISISIDDFGTGYSSLGHLKNFPITCFKIDKSFVDGLPSNRQDAAIVKTILSLGENLAVDVVVEGVETAEQRDFLTTIGARIIQGYFYAKPLAVEEITQRLRNE